MFYEPVPLGNYESYNFDTNGDGLVDVEIRVPYRDKNRHAEYYLFDRDYDRRPDRVYKDNRREGICAGSITVEYDRERDSKPSNRHDGTPLDQLKKGDPEA